MSGTTKKRQRTIGLRLSSEVLEQLKHQALSRGVTQVSLVEQALINMFEQIEFDSPTSRRLEELVRQSKRLARDNELLLEAFALFVRVFVTQMPMVNEAERAAAEKQGGVRYEKYLAALGQRFKNGKLFSKVLEDKIASMQDFEAQR